jgi:flagella basal body P-ring formation protein FlgA
MTPSPTRFVPEAPRVSRKLALLMVMVAMAWCVARVSAESPDARANPTARDAGRLQQVVTRTAERFVPAPAAVMTRVELRHEADVIGADITLAHIARWPARVLPESMASLVVDRFDDGQNQRVIPIDLVRESLTRAGVNPAMLELAGAIECTVTRGDAAFDEADALKQWVEGGKPLPVAPSLPTRSNASSGPITSNSSGKSITSAAPTAQGGAAMTAAGAAANMPQSADSIQPSHRPDAVAAASLPQAVRRLPLPLDDDLQTSGVPATRRLREMLIDHLAARLRMPLSGLTVDFRPEDRPLLDLVEGTAEFDIKPLRGDLGPVAWQVDITVGRHTRTATVVGNARAWVNQVVLARPLSGKQLITEMDVEERPMLVDRTMTEPPLAMQQVVGQQASRDLRIGTVLTARHVDPVQLARAGQSITVVIRRGSMEIKTVATALSAGTYGSAIKVRNESTRQVLEATLVGPQLAVVGDAGTDVATLAE